MAVMHNLKIVLNGMEGGIMTKEGSEKGHLKEELIRQAAVRVIGNEGFSSSTTDKIAAEAGVAVGTIYNYFKNKEDILSRIFQAEYQKRNEFFTIIQGMGLSAKETLRTFLKMNFAEVNKNPEMLRILLEEKYKYLRIVSAEEEPDQSVAYRQLIEDVMQQGMAEGEIKDCDSALVTGFILGAIEVVLWEALQKKVAGEEYGPLLDMAVEEIIGLITIA